MVYDAALHAKIDTFIEENREALLADLAALVAAKSVEGTPAPGAPFGPGPREALDVALAIAARMGFATNDGDGYVGWAGLAGETEEYLATITHVDVVPEGEGWDGDPYTLRQKDGWLIGRGVEDDKGPGILCLYAAKCVGQLLGTPRYSLRVLLGCNEESGMDDVPYYLSHNPAPLFCFSPDADFPVCNGEKGHFGGGLLSPRLNGNIRSISGGCAPNVIPDRAVCTLQNAPETLPDSEWVRVSLEGTFTQLHAKGIGGHAAHPAGTVNAIGRLVEYLLDNALCSGEEEDYLRLLQKLHSARDGSGVGIDATDPVFDPLTISGGIITMREGIIRQDMDCRFPPSTSAEAIEQTLRPLAQSHGAALEVGRCAAPFYLPADIPPVKALMDSYNEVTGREAKTFTMGGGTYARLFPCAVSFGPAQTGEEKPAFVGAIHGANEGISVESMLRALKIYILALLRLQEVDF